MLQKDSNFERIIKNGYPSHKSLISNRENETFAAFQVWLRKSTTF